ncbi:hypothetical protein BHM03_00041749 [Ensete ventricosum]|nr:hypothetical protein BHM03_00041749 [Ensete ventricosum]
MASDNARSRWPSHPTLRCRVDVAHHVSPEAPLWRYRLAAPAIAAGFSALAPTLGTLVPIIGSSGFATAATVAGSAAGSAAVAASFGAAGAGLAGSKMARRVGDIEEFDFVPIGENHNQGRLAVGIYVSGFVFEEEDFARPWDAIVNNSER